MNNVEKLLDSVKFVTIPYKLEEYDKYSFFDIKEKEIQKLKKVINYLMKNKDVIVCSRGDIKDKEFIDKNLFKFFIVGEKAKNNYKRSHKTLKKILEFDIKFILDKCNKILDEKSAKHPQIKGTLNKELIEYISKIEKKEQEKYKLIFYSFLHNKGGTDSYKSESPFISLTYGDHMISTAKKFAKNNIENKNPIIYLYIINKSLKNYYFSDSLKKFLKEKGVEWFDDIHKEIMLLGALYPHYLIGFFDIEKDRFILNPWFYKLLTEEESPNFSEGVYISQQNFKELALELGISNFVSHNDEKSEFASEIDGNEKTKVPKLDN